MPQFMYFGSQQSQCRVLNLWNGSSNDPEPAGWYLPGFDDSGWLLSSAPTVSFPTDFEGFTYLRAGVEAVAPWTTAPSTSAKFLYRQHVTIPSGWEPYYLVQYVPNDRGYGTIYVNGYGMLGTGISATLPTGALTFSTDTVIAGERGFSWASSEAWMGFYLVMYVPDPGGLPHSWGTIDPGVNDTGVLGTGDAVSHLTPTPMDVSNLPNPAAPGIVKVVSNGKTTLLLDNRGLVYGCGDNSTGLLGPIMTGPNAVLDAPDTNPHLSPVPMIIAFWPAVDIAIGDDCAAALSRSGALWTWGPNVHGSMGLVSFFGTGAPIPSYHATSLLGTVVKFSVGKDFTFAVQNANNISDIVKSTGNNTYGQLGQGTSGGDMYTYAPVVGSFFTVVDLSCGDDQTLMMVYPYTVYGCGRADYGSLGDALYAAGAGPNRIISTLTDTLEGDPGMFVSGSVRQVGPLSFLSTPNAVPGFVKVLGDGIPYGGAGDDLGNWLYGTNHAATTGYARYGTMVNADATNFVPAALANNGGGSHGQYSLSVPANTSPLDVLNATPGDSRVAFGAIGQDGYLYTWGYGGFGQMGNGLLTVTNLTARWQSGLTNVIQACLAERVAFAIAATGPIRRGGRSYAQIIG